MRPFIIIELGLLKASFTQVYQCIGKPGNSILHYVANAIRQEPHYWALAQEVQQFMPVLLERKDAHDTLVSDIMALDSAT